MSPTPPLSFSLSHHHADIRALMRRYRDRPISLADAAMIRLSEIHPASILLTFDADFRIYRRNGTRVIPVLLPDRDP